MLTKETKSHAGVIAGVLTGAAVFGIALGALEIRAWLAGPKAVDPGKSTLFVISSDAWVPQALEAVTDEEGNLTRIRIGRKSYTPEQIREGVVLAQGQIREIAGISTTKPMVRLRGSRDFNEKGGVINLVLTRDSSLIPSDDRLVRLSIRAQGGTWKTFFHEGSEPAPFEQLHIEAMRSYDTEPDSLQSGTGSGQAKGAKIITVVHDGQTLAHYNTSRLEIH